MEMGTESGGERLDLVPVPIRSIIVRTRALDYLIPALTAAASSIAFRASTGPQREMMPFVS